MSWDGANLTNRIDGTINDSVAATGSIGSLSSEPVKIGQSYGLYFSELLIFQDKLSDADQLKLEGYLAHKWALNDDLPTGHNYKTSAPSFGGWAIKRASSGGGVIALEMEGAGGEFSTPAPINDGEWHNLTTTYGGGVKRFIWMAIFLPLPPRPGRLLPLHFPSSLGILSIHRVRHQR